MGLPYKVIAVDDICEYCYVAREDGIHIHRYPQKSGGWQLQVTVLFELYNTSKVLIGTIAKSAETNYVTEPTVEDICKVLDGLRTVIKDTKLQYSGVANGV